MFVYVYVDPEGWGWGGGGRSGAGRLISAVSLYIDDDLFSDDVGGRTQKKGWKRIKKRGTPQPTSFVSVV
jgi:hypothetical protein